MARTVRDRRLDTRAARLRLVARREPYWRGTGKPGLHLGYRRIAQRNGTWVSRAYLGKPGTYAYSAFALADDYSDGDSAEVLTYYEAQHRIASEEPPAPQSSAYTVANAVADYLVFIGEQRKSLADARSRLTAYVLPYFGTRTVASLVPADLEQWRSWAMKHDPRANAPKRKAPRPATEDERLRQRKVTINKATAYLLAALNRAHQLGHAKSRDAWSRLRKFRGAESARIARLSAEEARRLCNACPPDFRRLVEVALLTGCRYGELTRFRARDFDAGSGTMLVEVSKSGKPRRVPLTDEGRRLLESLILGKAPDDIILVKADGTPWKKNDQGEPMRNACTVAKISPAITFHSLRHTTASLLVEQGTALAFVAEVLGHADTRMVSKHYAHLAPSVVHEAVRKNLPSFGITVPTSNVRSLSP